MLVESFELHRIQIPLKTAFKHARYERTATDAVIVALRSSDGEVGFGEVLPRDYVTGETIEGVLGALGPAMGARFVGQRFTQREEVVHHLRRELDVAGRSLATFSGFELALLDLAGKSLGFALGDVLGGAVRPPLPAGVVIGFEVGTTALPRYCAVLRLSARRHIKVKVGLRDDRERLAIVSSLLKTPLRIDANGAWASAEEAIRSLRAMREIPIASVEQPLPPRDLEGARRIREETGLPVMADEAVCTLEDADRLISGRAADIFNIRLGKCGGVLGSLRLVERARASGLGCHLGTLVGETGLLTRAAEVFGRCVPGFDCLDGKAQNEHLLSEDILDNARDAVDAPALAAGLGVRVSNDRLRSHVVST
ncbi:mandelate racemase/muconate lactonizing enzyme family protein [Sorangium sp. So ce1182]|uniref:mandelate racemase/muconate lactonizing enzyme family protein n=1 Tax=Sorangium sp. So ce1182 TaxID=3133334 RepID=UPI003F628073